MPRPRSDLFEAFMERVEVQPNGCWLWIGHVAGNGYGRLFVGNKRTVAAHRWAYEHFIAPIPVGLSIDHVCHNADEACDRGVECHHRRCVNPAHLEAVPIRTNILRGKGSAAKKARQTRCTRGHLLAGGNLLFRGDGRRQCRECIRLGLRRRQHSAARIASNRRHAESPKAKETRRRYRARIRERNRAYQAQYFQTHKDEILAKRREKRASDPDLHRARQREYSRSYRARRRAAISGEA